MPPMKMTHAVDPKQDLMDKIGDLSEVEVFNNNILVAIYMRPNKTASGLYMPDDYVEQDKYQGKVGLVVKMGNSAFEDETGRWFKGVKVNVGDWVVFRPSDGWSVAINSQPCRLMDDVVIRGRVKHPDLVW
jgi:co-chaperonin GroES (HSP10)